jgi:hypothetical protein
MAQADYVVANGTGAAVRSDLNGQLAAIVSNNSGVTEPATTYAYQWWADTTTGFLKLRNAANNAWITLRGLDGALTTDNGVTVGGAYKQTVVAVAALNIDCSLGNYFTKTINANSTFTVSNVPSGVSYSFTLELTHTSGTVTYFSGVEFPGSIAPILTTGKTHLFMFVTDDGGSRWRAAALVDYTN